MPLLSTYNQYKELESPSRVCGSYVLSKVLSIQSLKCKSSAKSETSSSSDEWSAFGAFPRHDQQKQYKGFNPSVAGSRCSNSSNGTRKKYVLGASKNPRGVDSSPTSILDCILFGGSVMAMQNNTSDSIFRRSTQMDQTIVPKTPARPIQPTTVQLDPLAVNEMTNKHLQNGKRGGNHQRLINSTSTLTSSINHTTYIDFGSELHASSTNKPPIQMPKRESEKEIKLKTMSSPFEVVGQPNRPESTRLQAPNAIERTVKDRQQKLEAVSACSDRCQKNLKESDKKVEEEVTGRGSTSDTDGATIAELRRESNAYRAQAIALREEMEGIRKELDTIRRYLPVVRSIERGYSTVHDENRMDLDERFMNTGDYPGNGFRNEWGGFSFETEGNCAMARNKGDQYQREQHVHYAEHHMADAYTREDSGLFGRQKCPNKRSGSSMNVTTGLQAEASPWSHTTYQISPVNICNDMPMYKGSDGRGHGRSEIFETTSHREMSSTSSRSSPRHAEGSSRRDTSNGHLPVSFDYGSHVFLTENNGSCNRAQFGVSQAWHDLQGAPTSRVAREGNKQDMVSSTQFGRSRSPRHFT